MASGLMKKSSSSGSLSALASPQHPHHPAVSRLRPNGAAIPRAASSSNLQACERFAPQQGAFTAPRPLTDHGASPNGGRRGLPPLSALGAHHHGEAVRFVSSAQRAGLLAAAAQEQAATQVFATSGAQAGHEAAAASEAAMASSCSSRGQATTLKQQQASAGAAAGAGGHGAPFASLTRVFLIGAQPSNIMRQLAGARKWRVAGPVSLLLFLFGLVLAILTAVRTVLVRRVRACQCCKGYGIVRCRLCNGEGTVAWMGKNNHEEMCPLCMTKRFVTCPDCGGYHHKKMFTHIQATPTRGLVPEFLGSA